MDANVYSQAGKKSGSVNLPKELFGLPWNSDLVHQVSVSLASNKRKPIAHTKTRGEVRGGGKKPWQQKGTGRARHGSTRSPIWVGGGVTHGPRNDKNYERKVSKSMRAKALYVILSRKFKDGELLFVDSVANKEPKTRLAVATMSALAGVKGYERLNSKKNAAVIALAEKNKETERSFKNISNVEVLEARNLNPLAILSKKFVIIENPEVALKNLPSLK